MKYGFVYLWFDRKHKRYYIGAHWGAEDDGYICSSPWMKQAYSKRPEDFRRRILARIYTTRKDVFVEEAKWQSLIKDGELRVRYYNLRRHGDMHWSTDDSKAREVREKLKLADNTRGLRAYNQARRGKPLSDETKRKLSKAQKDRPKNYSRTEATRAKISENSKRLQHEGKIGMTGKTHSPATKNKMSINNAMNKPELRKKVSEAKKGAVCLFRDGAHKYAQLASERYDSLIAAGYSPKSEFV